MTAIINAKKRRSYWLFHRAGHAVGWRVGNAYCQTKLAIRQRLDKPSNGHTRQVLHRIKENAVSAYHIGHHGFRISAQFIARIGNTNTALRIRSSRIYRFNPVILYGAFLRNRSPVFSATMLTLDNTVGLKPFYVLYGAGMGLKEAMSGGILYGFGMAAAHMLIAFAVCQKFRLPMRAFHATCLAANAAQARPEDFMDARKKIIRRHYKKKIRRTIRTHTFIKKSIGIKLNTRKRYHKLVTKQNALIRRNPCWYRVSRIFLITSLRGAKRHARSTNSLAQKPAL